MSSEPPVVHDELQIDVPAGGRVFVVSDLRLRREPSHALTASLTELARAIEAVVGPGAVIIAGNLVDLLTVEMRFVDQVLIENGRLVNAIKAFATAPDRQVVCLVGERDHRLAWDPKAARLVSEALGAQIALAADVHIETGRGERVVRVEPGHRFDPAARMTDARNPLDTPLAQHMTTDMLGPIAEREDEWLEGVDRLASPSEFPAFLASRLAYRRISRHLGWLLLPFLIAILLRFPLAFALIDRVHRLGGVTPWARRLLVVGSATVLDLAAVAGVLYLATRRAWRALSGLVPGERRQACNRNPRAEARRLIASGHSGLITGYTNRPELTLLGEGFYANSGCCTEVVDQAPARFGLPPVFLPLRLLSWVELEAGADLHVRLFHARQLAPGSRWIERTLGRPEHLTPTPSPEVTASYPQGPSWPPVVDLAPRMRRVRRVAATAIAVAGGLDLVSAITPPIRGRLEEILRIVPLAVPQTATALVALAGLGLLFVARGIRRGQRHAWSLAMTLLGGSVLLHLLKGGDLEEAFTAVAVGAYLLYHRGAFAATADRPSLRRAFTALAGGMLTATVAGTVVVETMHRRAPRMPIGRALLAVAERLVGLGTIDIPGRIDDFLTPALAAMGLGLFLFAGWLVFRPVVARRHAHDDDVLRKARDAVRKYGKGTLSYFALRDDKQFFFWGESVVAYAVFGGVCLVSPDPIGPAPEATEVWTEFRRFADSHGWSVAVMGASEGWLPTYRDTGMHELYVGDEAVVDVRRFNLEGGRNKGLRQAVNRVAKYGYRCDFYDPAKIDGPLRAQLLDVMTQSRRGDVERGFSMTLGRIFDADDKDLLLTVCYGPEDKPVAFCQFVPAPGIEGYSLDLMRRDEGDHPNGILDFVIVETIRELQRREMRRLSLNFATMRAVLTGEAGEGITQRVERWLLRRMSDSMQIESLWKFNAKYDPDWRPVYAVYDARENMLPAALAVARAESFWELPLIGRFLTPTEKEPTVGGA